MATDPPVRNCPQCIHPVHAPHMCITTHPHTREVCGCKSGAGVLKENGLSAPEHGTMAWVAQQERAANANVLDKLQEAVTQRIDRAEQKRSIPTYRNSLLYLLFHLQDMATRDTRYVEHRDAVIAWLRDELES